MPLAVVKTKVQAFKNKFKSIDTTLNEILVEFCPSFFGNNYSEWNLIPNRYI